MTIDVVIPNFNGSDIISENLPKVIDEVEKYNAKIIIVDDGSNIDDFEKLKTFVNDFKNVLLLRNEKNVGFSSTVNKGVKASNAELIVLLNSDVYPEKNFLDPVILDFEKNENLFGVGMMDKSIEDGKVVLRGRGIAKFTRGILVHSRGEVDKTDTFWISGGSSVIRRDLFEKINGFDELYNPFYWEDIDLSYRARKAGYEIMFENKSVVVHQHNKGAIKKYYSKSQINRIAYRNQFIFHLKNLTDIDYRVKNKLWFFYHFIKAIFRLDVDYFAGYILTVFIYWKIIEHSMQQMQSYKMKDRDLF